MAVGTLLSRLTGIGRTVAFIALPFGIVTDPYTVANNSPNMVYELVVGGVLSATLVPLFVGLLRPGHTRRDREGVSAIVTLSLTLVVALSVALWVGAPWVIRSFGNSNKPGSAEFSTRLLRMFAPQVALYGCVTLSTALLQTRRVFAISMFAPILNNVIVIGVFVWVRRLISQVAPTGTGTTFTLSTVEANSHIVRVLGWGTTLGVFAMFAVTLPALRSANLGLRLIWKPTHPAIKELIGLTGWTMGYVVSNQVALWFVIRTASLNVGDLTLYTSANSTFFQLPHGVIAVSIIAAIGPSLSDAFLSRSRRRFRALLSQNLRLLLLLMIPAAAGMAVLALPLTEIVLSRSQSVETARSVGEVLRYLTPGLPAFSCYLLLIGGFKAMRDTRTTFEINVVENALNIIVGASLYFFFGIRGLAAGFAVAYCGAAVIAFAVMRNRTAGLDGRRILVTLWKSTAASGAMVGVLVLSKVLAERGLVPQPEDSGRWLAVTAMTVVLVPLGVTVYIGVARILGLTEITAALTTVKRRLSLS